MDLDADFIDALQSHPQMAKLNGELQTIDIQIQGKLESLKMEKDQYTVKIKQLSDMLKTKITEPEKAAIRISLADARKTAKLLMSGNRKKIMKMIS